MRCCMHRPWQLRPIRKGPLDPAKHPTPQCQKFATLARIARHTAMATSTSLEQLFAGKNLGGK